MAFEILSGDVVVARQVDDNWVESTGTGLELPADLFHHYSEGRVHFGQVSEWLKRRTFPKNRVGAEELIKEAGLEEYNAIKLAKLASGKMFQDSFWVRWTDGPVPKKKEGGVDYPKH